ncbi:MULTISPECIES: M28 family metallopeptidase [Anaerolinea]|uniref:M28 family metallopeptidase n=1 Tax=Anaerolinea TaxID=233189 RepID=UPI00262CA534|nr:M28 family peptidase [Anaerolinea thermophila]
MEPRSLTHIRHLISTVGARASCSPAVRHAALECARLLEACGAVKTRLQSFRGVPETYLPFLWAFGAAALGSLLALLGASSGFFAVGAVLNALGVWAMLAESEFRPHWATPLLPRRETVNLIARFDPLERPRRSVVLCAHLDTHRTPVFYSTGAWLKAFGALVTGCFLSMALGTLALGLAAFAGWEWMRGLALPLFLVQSFAAGMMVHALRTPHTPGANDNASGIGVILSMAERLMNQPLRQTCVWVLLTDCEETGAWGMRAFLNRHAEEVDKNALYVILDQVGAGELRILTRDGLIFKHPTHPEALKWARKALRAQPLACQEIVGTAYTDALPATLQGRIALTVCAIPPSGETTSARWHQMSDVPEALEPQALSDAETFTWAILQELDRPE